MIAKKEEPAWTPLLILTAVATILGTAFPAGYNMGILNAPQDIITKFCNESIFNTYGTVMEETPLNLLWSFVVSIFLIGGCFGAFMGGPIANKIGRCKCSFITTSSLLEFESITGRTDYSSMCL